MSQGDVKENVDCRDRFDDLFPLPLRAFEELFVQDDNGPLYPAVFSMRFYFEGKIDTDLAATALNDVMTRQPMLNVRLRRKDDGRLEWVPAGDDDAGGRIFSNEPFDRLRSIDLQNEPPIRLHVNHHPVAANNDETEITFQFHHAVVDGVGAFAVINDWMRAYDRLSSSTESTSPKTKRLKQPKFDMLRNRCRSGLTRSEWFRLARWYWLSLIGFWNFFFNTPIPLVPKAQIGSMSAGTSSADQPDPIISATIDQDATESLKARANELEVTTNDLMAVELLATVKQWQTDQQLSSDGSHIRISIPINERGMRHRKMPACNHCTMISLDRRPDQIPIDPRGDSFRKLVQTIHHEIDTVREWRLSLTFWSSLSLFRRLGGLKKWFATEEIRSTCVLTNLGQLGQRLRLPTNQQGEVLVAGNRLTQVEVAAPIRYGTAAAFAVYVYRRQLTITMNYDRTSLSRDQAESLLQQFTDRLGDA
jgi:NRPS condensation-like uncharacterized protein